MEDNATPFGDTPADGQQAPAPAEQQAAQQPPAGQQPAAQQPPAAQQQVAPAAPADGQQAAPAGPADGQQVAPAAPPADPAGQGPGPVSGYSTDTAQQSAVPAGEGPGPVPPPAMYPSAPSAVTGKATAALVLGIVSIVACPSVVLAIGLGIAAIVLANQHAKSFGATGKSKGGKACGIAGIVLGVLWGAVWTLAISLGVWAFSTTSEIYDTPYDAPGASQDAGGSEAGDPEPDDDVIIAGGVDTASKYTFDVETAVVGLDEYSETPVVILMGEFTNDSDETVSFSGALSGSASQDGYSLDEAYLQGASTFNYESIAPGKTVPVFIGWELWDGESDVEISVRDQYHYAKEVVYEETFTIDELLANTKAFADELDGIIDDEKELTA